MGVVRFSSLCLAEPFPTALDAFVLLNNLVGILLASSIIWFRIFYMKGDVYISLRTQKSIFTICKNHGFDIVLPFLMLPDN